MVRGRYADALAEDGDDKEAASEYRKALHWSAEPTPYRAYLLYRLATIEINYSDAVEAATHLREALLISPNARDYHAMLAQALRRQGRRQEADQEMKLEVSLRK